MIYISHRGNLNGPKPELENRPDYVEQAIANGFDVEVDLWANDSGLFLGHDGPQYPVPKEWLIDRTNQIWIHCKNPEALDFCMRHQLHCFFHNTDDYTITSRGYVWAFPGKPVASSNCIMVMPETHSDIKALNLGQHAGVCSDYIKKIKMPFLREVDFQMHFVIATPLVGWKCDAKEHLNWMVDRAEIMRKFPNVKWFSAFELDNRGIEPFREVIDALKEVNGDYWTYSINDMNTQVTSGNRWIRIETGRKRALLSASFELRDDSQVALRNLTGRPVQAHYRARDAAGDYCPCRQPKRDHNKAEEKQPQPRAANCVIDRVDALSDPHGTARLDSGAGVDRHRGGENFGVERRRIAALLRGLAFQRGCNLGAAGKRGADRRAVLRIG